VSEHHRSASWAAAVRVNKPRIAAALPARCIDCGRPVTPDQRWQVGHIVPVAVAKAQGWTVQQINHPTNLGPSHTKGRGQRACNQIAGGKLGASISNARRKAAEVEEGKFPGW
jgi:hypothetical protein